jgi:hypothetical protein
MANQTITQLPDAGPITGTELVPIVQNGGTYKTTASALAGSPVQTQTFLTLSQEPTLNNSRYLSASTGIGLTDGGAQSFYRITLNGVSGTLEAMGNGFAVKVGGTMTPRSIASSGSGVTVTNGDGQSGNPTIALDGTVDSLANNSGTGFLALPGNGTVSGRTLTSTPDQIDITNPNGIAGSPVFSIADNAVFPGVEGVTVPSGTTAERPSVPNDGEIRCNTDLQRFEAYVNGLWQVVGSGDGTVSTVVGTADQITVVNPTTTPQVSISSNPVIPGSGSITVPSGDTASRPAAPANGMIRYNTNIGLFEGYVNGLWSSFASGSGVTSIATGTGLTGGPITSTGTISIANTAVTAGAYGGAAKTLSATVNAQGQLTALSETNIAIANTQVSGLGTMSTQNANSVAITGGTINATSIGGTAPNSGNFTSVAMTSGTITTAPTSGTDIVNKTYADAIASGIHFHEAVNLATTAALPANTYNNGTSGVGATLTGNANGALSIDSTLTTVTERVLIKNEVTQANNGVYTVTQVGSAGTPYILTRATDFDSVGTGVDQIDEGDFFLVTSGTANVNTAWVQQTPPPITIGTTAIVFQQFSAPITYSAGTGLSESPAYTFNIANTAVTSGSYGSASSVATFSVNAQGQLTAAANATIAIAGTQITSGVVATANGGTGLTSYTSGGIVYASSSSALASGSALTFDGTTFNAPNSVITSSSSSNALRITQTGSGNALVVEDSASTDSTPFVIDAVGQVIIGNDTALTYASSGAITPQFQVNKAGAEQMGISRFTADTGGNAFAFLKSRGATIGAFDVVLSGDTLGTISWYGADGTTGVTSASITAAVDGTPGTGDMPGRLVFSTTPDGSGTPTERLRIDSFGQVGIGAAPSVGRTLTVSKSITGSTTGFGLLQNGQVQSDVTTTVYGVRNDVSTAATAFTLTSYYHYYAQQNTIGAGSSITSQYGFYVGGSLTGATNNYGFTGAIASGTGRWNLYMSGTADNYLAGNVGIGSGKTSPATALDVNGTITATAYTGINGGTF